MRVKIFSFFIDLANSLATVEKNAPQTAQRCENTIFHICCKNYMRMKPVKRYFMLLRFFMFGLVFDIIMFPIIFVGLLFFRPIKTLLAFVLSLIIAFSLSNMADGFFLISVFLLLFVLIFLTLEAKLIFTSFMLWVVFFIDIISFGSVFHRVATDYLARNPDMDTSIGNLFMKQYYEHIGITRYGGAESDAFSESTPIDDVAKTEKEIQAYWDNL